MFKTLNLKKLILSILIPYAVAFLAWLLTKDGMKLYADLNTPPFAPPGTVFPIAWAILYLMMGISLYCVANSPARQQLKSLGYITFGLQLFFNFAWTIIFFMFMLYTFSAIWLVVLIVLIIINIIVFARASKVSAYLLIPYLLWCVFALYLNIGIAVLN